MEVGEPPGIFPNNRDHLLALLKRFSATSLAIIFLVASLFGFSKVGHLDKWEQRGFNSLAILFTGIMSLGLGSLVGYLGSMIRWPLLSRTSYRARDVDLILAMASPPGALRLVYHHVREWKWTRTTSIVALYFIVNISGRLSVAIFGLTFNLAETGLIEYPVQRANWSENPTGMKQVSKRILWELNSSQNQPNLLEILGNNLDIKNMSRRFDGDSVEYSYSLGEYRGSVVIGSYDTIYSSASCNAISVNGSEVYHWLDGRTEYVGESPTSVTNETTTDLYYESPPVTSQYNRSGVIWSCRSYLMDGQKKPGTVSGSGIPGAQTHFVTNSLFTTALNERFSWMYNYTGNTSSLLEYTTYPTLYTRETAATGLTTISLPYAQRNSSYRDPQSSVAVGSRLYIAVLVARMPLLAIAVADSQLFRSNRDDPNATAKPYIETTLEIKWRKVVGTIGAIVVGQILAIMVVLLYCRGVFIRDDSYLSTAQLLNTIMNKVDRGSLGTGEQLAKYLDDSFALKVKYGTKRVGDRRMVDISDDVEQSFPSDQMYERISGA
ncbi:hypothetical protein K440DRAFT_605725 [Wilcoxina mikolae CBS 423.85]|nr:hypothetical protein K440DRAFT_605725 [Wilcoxina mikolae CBS 423.85]